MCVETEVAPMAKRLGSDAPIPIAPRSVQDLPISTGRAYDHEAEFSSHNDTDISDGTTSSSSSSGLEEDARPSAAADYSDEAHVKEENAVPSMSTCLSAEIGSPPAMLVEVLEEVLDGLAMSPTGIAVRTELLKKIAQLMDTQVRARNNTSRRFAIHKQLASDDTIRFHSALL
eukprot:5826217-Pyramimonas_sp.AAC.1